MKIAVISGCFNHSTGRRNVRLFSKLANKYHVNIDLFTINAWREKGNYGMGKYFDDKNLERDFNSRYLKIYKLKAYGTRFGQFKYVVPSLALHLIKSKPDIIFANEEPIQIFVTFPSLLVAKLIGKPFCFFTWENINQKWFFPLNVIEKFIIKQSTMGIAGTQDCANVLYQKGMLKSKVRICPQAGVDTSIFKPTKSKLNKKLGFFKDRLILFIGRFIPEKGLPIILKARDELLKRGRRYNYLFVGTGQEEKTLRRTLMGARDSKILPWVKSEDLPEYYSAGAVFVYPSIPKKNWIEGFGYAQLESLACGTPVIASDISGPRVVIENGKDGFLIPVGDHMALADKIEYLIEHPKIRKRFGQSGRKKVVIRFSNEYYAKIWYSIFKILLAKKYDSV